jgi:predicted nucleic acid-binding protein
MLIDSGKFEISVSVPLVLEYEAAAKRLVGEIRLTEQDVEAVVDYACRVADRRPIHFLWRPVLKDPKDEMVLELAVAAECDAIVTFNRKDFDGVERFGLRVLTPREFLTEIGEFP